MKSKALLIVIFLSFILFSQDVKIDDYPVQKKVKTMSEGLAKIKNIKETNKVRKKIGLQDLKEGEFEVF